MSIRAVTFDFHNTIARCDEWFALEVRDLVPAVLKWYSDQTGTEFVDDQLELAVERYRALRMEIIHHGEEVDALDCSMHVLSELGITIDRSVVDEGIHAVMRDTLEGSSPIPGVIDAVNGLTGRGIRLGVVSSAVFHPFLEWSLSKFGIADCFETVITSASCGYYKSRTEIYEHALQTLNVESHATVHVGDSYRFDVLTARRLGIGTVWYRNGSREIDGGINEADLTVDSLHGVESEIIRRFVVASDAD